MCNMTDVLYVYCDDHYGRQIISPCPSAMNHPGLATTGCWNAVTTSHTRVLDFCPVCKKAGKDTEEYRQDKEKQFYQFDKTVEGPETAITEVTVRPIEERGQGQDSKIWLKSFGGSSANASAANSANVSRRGSVDPEARRDSHASIMSTTSTTSTQSTNSSTKSIPEIMSKSRYCKEPTSAAWGMTPEELHERSTTYLMENGKRSGTGTTRPSRTSNLDTVEEKDQEQEQQFFRVPETPRGRPVPKVVNFSATRESRSINEELSPLLKTPRIKLASLSTHAMEIGLGKRIFEGYKDDAQKKTQQELFERQYAISKKYGEEEKRLLAQPARASLLLAREEVNRKFEHMKTKPNVLEHMARRLERQRLECEESEGSSRSSSASRKVERRLSIRPDVRWHMKKLAEKLRRAGDEKLGLEVGEVGLGLGCGERVDDVDDEIMAAVEEAQRGMRKDRGDSATSFRGRSLCKEDLEEITDMMSAGLPLRDIRKRLRQESQDSAIDMEYDELE